MGPPGERAVAERVRGASAHRCWPRRREVHHAEPVTAATTAPPTSRPTGLPADCSSVLAGAPAAAGSIESVGLVDAAAPAADIDGDPAGPDGEAVGPPDATGADRVGAGDVPLALRRGTGVADADGPAEERGRGPDAEGAGVGVPTGSGTTGAHSPTG